MKHIPFLIIAISSMSINAFGQATAAGAKLTTAASISFSSTDGRTVGSVYSNPASVQVSQVLKLAGVSSRVGGTARPTQTIYYPVKVINTGNGYDRFLLSTNTPPPGWSVRILPDHGNDGVHQWSENYTVNRTTWLDQGQSYYVLLEIKVPTNGTITDGCSITLTAVSEKNSGVRWQATVVAGMNDYLDPKWWYPLNEQINGSVNVGNNRVYAATDRGAIRVHNISGQNAVDEWTIRIAGIRFVGTPVVQGTTLLVQTSDKRLAQFDLISRQFLRFLNTGTGFNPSSNPVALPSEQRTLAAVLGSRLASIQQSGNISLVSERHSNAEASTTPVTSGRTVFVGYTDGSIAALDSSTLRIQWRLTLEQGSAISHPPVIDTRNNLLFASTTSGKMFCVSTTSRNLRWSVNAGSKAISAVSVDAAKEGIYFITQNRQVWGFNRLSGQAILGFPMTLPGTGEISSVAVSGKRSTTGATPYIWVGAPGGEVFAINANNGYTFHDWANGPGWKAKFVGQAAVNTTNNTVVIAAQDGRVFGFGMK